MLHKIVFTKTAEKEFKYLYKRDAKIFERIRRALRVIAGSPYEGKPLKLGLKGKWSYRVGSYRIIYSIERNILTVYILDIGHRREVYKS